MGSVQRGRPRLRPLELRRVKRKIRQRLRGDSWESLPESVAHDLGVFQQNISRYELGTTPHLDFLITLALKEGISLDWLLLGRGRMRRRR